ncbi:Hsp70 family protein [Actinoplanes sp. TRM 88003]|uniref:Hsp70 family protein n=1 Tax=Paractinoplanes aksuensis TaxID=2939490 RepID=A0ABT1DU17_9ACTN|nr:Hsp70 family protein [Actinoplanes aksuensis]MCO8274352.1 Hsp70 family protein [Actinoplanes aksuensis]
MRPLLPPTSFGPGRLDAVFGAVAAEVHRTVGPVSVDAVVSCPLSWDAAERDALALAAALAGLGTVEVVAEPLAAASWLEDTSATGSVLVVDVGAVTADVTLVRRVASGFETVAAETVRGAAGEALDAGLTELVRTWVAVAGGLGAWSRLRQPATTHDERARQELTAEIVAAREALSWQPSAALHVPLADVTVTVPGAQFEAVAARVLEPVVRAVAAVLARSTGPVTVLLVGGTSRMPLLAQLVASVSGSRAWLAPVPEPELVVARGCATWPRRALLDDDVRFTVYRPRRLTPGEWESLLLYAHKSDPVAGSPDPLAEVERRARQHFGGSGARSHSVDAARPLTRGAALRVVPELDGAECNPPSAELRWQEAVHEVAFRVRPLLGAGQVVRGSVRVWCGPLVLGEVSVALPVGGAPTGAAPLSPEPMKRYRRIFPSYSSRDRDVVRQFVVAAQALGDTYLQDILTLRAGEDWDQRLLELIAEADVFQLFWSSNSMTSPNCRREWERALALRRPSFVRPVYWEDPLPRAPHLDLPPAQLQALHFAKVPVLVPAASPTADQAPIPMNAGGSSAAGWRTAGDLNAVRQLSVPPPPPLFKSDQSWELPAWPPAALDMSPEPPAWRPAEPDRGPELFARPAQSSEVVDFDSAGTGRHRAPRGQTGPARHAADDTDPRQARSVPPPFEPQRRVRRAASETPGYDGFKQAYGGVSPAYGADGTDPGRRAGRETPPTDRFQQGYGGVSPTFGAPERPAERQRYGEPTAGGATGDVPRASGRRFGGTARGGVPPERAADRAPAVGSAGRASVVGRADRVARAENAGRASVGEGTGRATVGRASAGRASVGPGSGSARASVRPAGVGGPGHRDPGDPHRKFDGGHAGRRARRRAGFLWLATGLIVGVLGLLWLGAALIGGRAAASIVLGVVAVVAGSTLAVVGGWRLKLERTGRRAGGGRVQ